MNLALNGPTSVVGVLENTRGIRNAVKYLHYREPVVEIRKTGKIFTSRSLKPEVDFSTPSKCKGMEVGLELGTSELELFRRLIREGRGIPGENELFWQAIVQYCIDYKLTPIPIDNEGIKQDYERIMERATKLRSKGKVHEADEMKLRALEDFIGGREEHMARRIKETGTQVNLVGTAQSEEVVKLLTEVHGLTAFAEPTTDATTEVFVSMDTLGYVDARTRYARRKMMEAEAK